MRHKYFNDGLDAYEEAKEISPNRGRKGNMGREHIAPAWKQGIPTIAGRYFYADDIRNLDIPRYCTVLKGESWGGPDVHSTYIEVNFIEYVGVKKATFVKSDKRGNYVDLSYTVDGIIQNTVLNEGLDLNIRKYWFYGPIDIPKEV